MASCFNIAIIIAFFSSAFVYSDSFASDSTFHFLQHVPSPSKLIIDLISGLFLFLLLFQSFHLFSEHHSIGASLLNQKHLLHVFQVCSVKVNQVL